MFSRMPGSLPGRVGGKMLCMRDWAAWHEAYDDPSSFLNVRLRMVRQRLSEAIGAAPEGPGRLVSLGAGRARAGAGVPPVHPRGDDPPPFWVNPAPRSPGAARRAAAQAGLHQVE